MSIHNIHFHGEIRKIWYFSGDKSIVSGGMIFQALYQLELLFSVVLSLWVAEELVLPTSDHEVPGPSLLET